MLSAEEGNKRFLLLLYGSLQCEKRAIIDFWTWFLAFVERR